MEQDFYIASPSTNPRKLLNVKELQLRTIDFETGLFYGTINNMEVAIIDDVRKINDDVVKLESNYTVDGDYSSVTSLWKRSLASMAAQPTLQKKICNNNVFHSTIHLSTSTWMIVSDT